MRGCGTFFFNKKHKKKVTVEGEEHWIAWDTQEEYDRVLKLIKLRAFHPEKTFVINRENQIVELTEDGETFVI